MSASTVLTCGLLLLVPAGAYAQQTCEADHQCPSDRFCYESRVCAPCIVCAAYNRLDSANHCAMEWQACGPCLPGFTSEGLTGTSKRGNCIKASNVDPTLPSAEESVMTTSVPQSVQVAMIVAIVLSLGSGTVYLAIKGRQRMRQPQQDVECGRQFVQEARLLQPSPRPLPVREIPPPGQDTPPPEYRQVALPISCDLVRPSAPLHTAGAVTMTGNVNEMGQEKLLQATPYRVSRNLRYHWDSVEEEVVEQEVEDDDSHTTPNNLDHGDETTQPSDWVPSNEDLRADDSGVCNISESASSSSVALDALPGPLDFHGMFVNGTLVMHTGLAAESIASAEPEAGERPAKRFRVDSGSHSAESSEDESQHEPQVGKVAKLGDRCRSV